MRDLLNTSILSRSGSDLEPQSTFVGGSTVSQTPFLQELDSHISGLLQL
jgi:hypothetical protein